MDLFFAHNPAKSNNSHAFWHLPQGIDTFWLAFVWGVENGAVCSCKGAQLLCTP